ncbi:MAG: helix-turn-helix transcriptional regulator [Selenomonadaceae bacterium]|nr:helix-turn-helix transcriptional regulator [Selenomonadaceae bacterium]
MNFGNNLRQYRESAGYAQAKDFAAMLGIKYTTYIAYEQGREPKYNILCRIAAALNVTIDELLGYSPPNLYQTCKKRLNDIGLDIYEEPDGKILVKLDEKGCKDEELKRIYDTAKIEKLGLPNKAAVVELVKTAELTALKSGFRDALLTLLLPWFIVAGTQNANDKCNS